MIVTEAYFENIKHELQLELSNAKKSIYVALAWFTDNDLLNNLIKKASEKVNVELLIYDDEINFGPYGLAFDKLEIAGGKLFIARENLMHNKFCIIDERIIITGSYNWTNKANKENIENIVIIKEDVVLAVSYITEFKKLTGKYENYSDEQFHRIIKRLQLIQKLIELHDVEDIALQITRLQKDDGSVLTNEIVKALQKKEYFNANQLINAFINQYNNVAIYIDPEVAALQLEIKLLEYQSVALDNEIAELEKQIADFNQQLHKRFGLLMKQIYEEKLLYFFLNKEKSKEAERQFEETQTKYEEFTKENLAEEQKHFFEITQQDSNEIKKIYKAATLLCHPDKFENATLEIKQKGEEIFKELNAANERNDITTVKQIYNQLLAGLLDVEIRKQDNKQLLLLQCEALNEKCKMKSNLLNNYKNSEVLKLLKRYSDLEEYFLQKETELQQELNHWQSKNRIIVNN